MLEKKMKRVEALEILLKVNKIQVPPEELEGERGKEREKESEKMDGVCLEGETTYNVTSKNLRQAEEQINTLKEQNGQQKQEISRLKEELMKKDSISTRSNSKMNISSACSSFTPNE
jgi:hypothetical protein